MKHTLVILATAGFALASISTASLAAMPQPTAKIADGPSHTKTVSIEGDVPQSPGKVWQALTQSPIIAKWLMKTDFKPVVGHAFKFTADWGAVDGKVLTVQPKKKLAYTWSAYGLSSVVTWTLTPKGAGTHVRMAQAGFPANQPQYYQGAQGGWQKYFGDLKTVLAH